ncbi:MAG: DUF134 domain-containing protein [Candidatus Diapherotrites archaeon]|jgi:predicted DNA-binding protein (UPF0251 family)|uniref:UPF0251 protein GX950_01895 n=1 Tax=Candidatus Iainarchaeum sp. TaxID=3101447 RepID=A0A7K4BZ71_9ARCH|nr:DUF134 domain-containing protein [Candidatus Diapherotrites archaeon]
MVRPRIPRRIRFEPKTTYFKPAGVPLRELKEVVLSFEEVEALRLKDVENYDQIKAANKMNISQPTFNRTINSARKKLAKAITNGKAIKIKTTKN